MDILNVIKSDAKERPREVDEAVMKEIIPPAPAVQPPLQQTQTPQQPAPQPTLQPLPQAEAATPKAPLAVEVMNFPQLQPGAGQPQAPRTAAEPADKGGLMWAVVVIGLGIFVVGVVQLMLFRRQLGIMSESLVEAEDAVNAAKQSADVAKDAATATKESVVTMKDTAQRQLRAYVHVSATRVVRKVEKDTAFEAIITVKNGGQTPAYEVKFYAATTIEDYPLKKAADFDKNPIATIKSFLAPGAELNLVAKFRALDDKALPDFMGGKTALYVQGILKYRDTFGENHIAEFRFAHAHRQGMYDDALFVCDKGNESD